MVNFEVGLRAYSAKDGKLREKEKAWSSIPKKNSNGEYFKKIWRISIYLALFSFFRHSSVFTAFKRGTKDKETNEGESKVKNSDGFSIVQNYFKI